MIRNSLWSYAFLIGLMAVSLSLSAETQDYSIKSESSLGDFKENLMRYTGNAIFQDPDHVIRGDEISAKRSTNGSMDIVNIIGKPATLKRTERAKQQKTNLTANHIRYQMGNREVRASENVHLQQELGEKNSISKAFDIKGNFLLLQQNDKVKMQVDGDPLTLVIKQQQEEPITVTAKKLDYDQESEQLELHGSVTLTRLQETMKAEKLLYNLKTGILQVPKVPNKRVEINRSKIE